MFVLRELVTRLPVVAALIICCTADGRAFEPKSEEGVRANAACASVQAATPMKSMGTSGMRPAVFKVVGEVLCVKGEFTLDSWESMSTISHPLEIKYLVIESGGGLVLPAIQLAEMAELYSWVVVVSGLCGSSCANYIFLSDTDKIVLRGAVVSWHGLPPSQELAKESFDKDYAKPEGLEILGESGLSRDQAWALAKKISAASERFFLAHGISQDLARTQPEASSSFTASYAELYRKARESGKVNWTYSPEALTNRWKVRGIRSMWYPTSPAGKEAATAVFEKQHGWQLFFFD
jgi:hypothetical protein